MHPTSIQRARSPLCWLRDRREAAGGGRTHLSDSGAAEELGEFLRDLDVLAGDAASGERPLHRRVEPSGDKVQGLRAGKERAKCRQR